ncbi:MAG: STN domain-containing protein [Opitutaceae bacterium]
MSTRKRECPRRHLALVTFFLCLLFPLVSGPAVAAVGTKKTFDISAGDALTTLKQFSVQGEVRLLYAVDAVKGVKTNAVKGVYVPREALDRLVAGVGLEVTENADGGVFAVSRGRANGPNVNRAAPTTARDRPTNPIHPISAQPPKKA